MHFHLPLFKSIGFRTSQIKPMKNFYETILEMESNTSCGGDVRLTTPDEKLTIHLSEELKARPKRASSTGLYHAAFLLPNRKALAGAVNRLINANCPIHGLIDHGVSEAIYTEDPDGNGVELTVDRPYGQWPILDGRPAMQTKGMNLEKFLEESQNCQQPNQANFKYPLLGHLHFNVNDLLSTRKYLEKDLGLNVTDESVPGALFFGLGDYHHHLAANVWRGYEVESGHDHVSGLIECGLNEPLNNHNFLNLPTLGI